MPALSHDRNTSGWHDSRYFFETERAFSTVAESYHESLYCYTALRHRVARAHTRTHMHAHTHTPAHTHTHPHTHTRAHAHTYTRTRTRGTHKTPMRPTRTDAARTQRHIALSLSLCSQSLSLSLARSLHLKLSKPELQDLNSKIQQCTAMVSINSRPPLGLIPLHLQVCDPSVLGSYHVRQTSVFVGCEPEVPPAFFYSGIAKD